MKEIEAGKRKITPDNIKEMAAGGLGQFHKEYYDALNNYRQLNAIGKIASIPSCHNSMCRTASILNFRSVPVCR